MPPRKRATRTEAPASPDATLDPEPDPEGVAADILGEGESGPSTSTERVRKYRARKRAEASEPAPEAPAVTVTPEETAALLRELWGMVVTPIAGKRKDGSPRLLPLTDEQSTRLGAAYAPLVTKYMPLVGAWQAEITALVVTVAVIRGAVNNAPLEHAEVYDLGGLGDAALSTGAPASAS